MLCFSHIQSWLQVDPLSCPQTHCLLTPGQGSEFSGYQHFTGTERRTTQRRVLWPLGVNSGPGSCKGPHDKQLALGSPLCVMFLRKLSFQVCAPLHSWKAPKGWFYYRESIGHHGTTTLFLKKRWALPPFVVKFTQRSTYSLQVSPDRVLTHPSEDVIILIGLASCLVSLCHINDGTSAVYLKVKVIYRRGQIG